MYTNGRFADAILRLLIRPGVEFTRLFVGLSLFSLCLLIYYYLKLYYRGTLHTLSKAYLSLMSISTLAVILFSHDYFFSDVLAWYSGAANYLLPTVLLLFGLIPSQHVMHGKPNRRSLFLLSTISLTIAQLAHELIETTLFLYFVFFVIYFMSNGKKLPLLLKAQITISVLVMLVHLTAPGIWQRMTVLADRSSEHPLFSIQLIYNFGNASQHIVWVFKYMLFLLSIIIAYSHYRQHKKANRIGIHMISHFMILFSNIIFMLIRKRFTLHLIVYTEGMNHYLIKNGILLISFLLLLMYAISIFVLILMNSETEMRQTLPWFGALIGSMAIPVLLGMQNVRGFFPAAIFLAIFSLSILSLNSDLERVKISYTLIAILGVFSLYIFISTAYKAAANRAVWDDIERQLRTARDSQTRTVRILERNEYPYPDFIYTYAYSRDRYENCIKLYYDVPSSTTLEWKSMVSAQ